MDEEVKDGEGTPEVKLTEEETRAIALGWKPKDQWQGGADDWVPAKWWLKYGDVEQRATTLEAENKHKEKVLNSMKNHYTRLKEDSVKEVMDIIKRQKKEALANQDYERVAELDAEGQVLEDGLKTAHGRIDQSAKQAIEAEPGPNPDFVAWNRVNTWYKQGSDDEMTKEADLLAAGYAQTHANATYPDVLKYVDSKIQKLFPEKFKKEEPPVTGVDEGGDREVSRPNKPKSSKYVLSDAEKEAARRFGIPEDEYAKELAAYDKKRGRG